MGVLLYEALFSQSLLNIFYPHIIMSNIISAFKELVNYVATGHLDFKKSEATNLPAAALASKPGSQVGLSNEGGAKDVPDTGLIARSSQAVGAEASPEAIKQSLQDLQAKIKTVATEIVEISKKYPSSLPPSDVVVMQKTQAMMSRLSRLTIEPSMSDPADIATCIGMGTALLAYYDGRAVNPKIGEMGFFLNSLKSAAAWSEKTTQADVQNFQVQFNEFIKAAKDQLQAQLDNLNTVLGPVKSISDVEKLTEHFKPAERAVFYNKLGRAFCGIMLLSAVVGVAASVAAIVVASVITAGSVALPAFACLVPLGIGVCAVGITGVSAAGLMGSWRLEGEGREELVNELKNVRKHADSLREMLAVLDAAAIELNNAEGASS